MSDDSVTINTISSPFDRPEDQEGVPRELHPGKRYTFELGEKYNKDDIIPAGTIAITSQKPGLWMVFMVPTDIRVHGTTAYKVKNWSEIDIHQEEENERAIISMLLGSDEEE